MKDIMSLNMEADGDVIIKGAQGITGAPTDSNFYHWYYSSVDHSVCSYESGKFQIRTRHHGHP